ncbi:MAG: hypothetical protein KBE25_06325 [Laribacter sp.]|nr:hypothetical protein [Laribacter sp.]MBP9527818.1 hypothetical protein [Laribacter sp.]MBP9608955.1 hypothetical protein [Laribacter sp.]
MASGKLASARIAFQTSPLVDTFLLYTVPKDVVVTANIRVVNVSKGSGSTSMGASCSVLIGSGESPGVGDMVGLFVMEPDAMIEITGMVMSPGEKVWVRFEKSGGVLNVRAYGFEEPI